MFTCITCTKADGGEEVDGGRGSGTPNTKEAVKSLTTQIKDMAVKFSGAYKQCKPCTGSPSYKHGHGTYHPDIDTVSEGVPYPYIGSSSSTPAWDFTGGPPGPQLDSRFTAASARDVVVEDEHESKEWVAQVEPGVHITFMSLPNGGNDLKRIRFSREMFNKWEAQRWWGENFERVMELYNVQRFNRQALQTPLRSEADEQRDSTYSRDSHSAWMPRNYYKPGVHGYSAGPSGLRNESGFDAARTTTSSCCRDEPSVSASNASEMETEWIEEDEPGVYITIRQLADGTRELRRVRFSRERFGEVNAKQWWEENRDRIQAQYL